MVDPTEEVLPVADEQTAPAPEVPLPPAVPTKVEYSPPYKPSELPIQYPDPVTGDQNRPKE